MNIAIIAPNDLYRESLKTALGQIPGFSLGLACGNQTDTIAQIAGQSIDVILIHSAIGEDDLEKFVSQLRVLSPGVRILMLLVCPEECWQAQALRYGADDALSQYADKSTLNEHIRQLHGDRSPVIHDV